MMSRANIIRAGPCGVAVRGVRPSTYAAYFACCSGVAPSVGITTSPCDARAAPPAGWWARNVSRCDRWISAKSSDSSARTTLLDR